VARRRERPAGPLAPEFVFISHATADTWVARQIASRVAQVGAGQFLDAADVHTGDDFDEEILVGLDSCTELLALFTPWAIDSRYMWLEIGAAWGKRKRLVIVLHGLTIDEFTTRKDMPIPLKRRDVIVLNDIDDYFEELSKRTRKDVP
jgi:TIR domain